MKKQCHVTKMSQKHCRGKTMSRQKCQKKECHEKTMPFQKLSKKTMSRKNNVVEKSQFAQKKEKRSKKKQSLIQNFTWNAGLPLDIFLFFA